MRMSIEEIPMFVLQYCRVVPRPIALLTEYDILRAYPQY